MFRVNLKALVSIPRNVYVKTINAARRNFPITKQSSSKSQPVISNIKQIHHQNRPNQSTRRAKEEPQQQQQSSTVIDHQKSAAWWWHQHKSQITLALIGMNCTCLVTYMIYVLGTPDGADEDDQLTHLPIWQQYLVRAYRELDRYGRLIKEPSREKLLPDPLTYPYLQPKYTLVLELTNVLVHPDWTYNTGWRFKKRPGLEYFLESLHGMYEIVVYTAEQGITVFPLIEAIDPKNLIAYKLVRDSTDFTGGRHVKCLDKLNRDLTKVIVVDWDQENVQLYPDNLLKIRQWDGSDSDSSLIDLSMFLQTIAKNDVEDVREVLKYYSKYDDPVEAFRHKQKQLIDSLEREVATKTNEAEQSQITRIKPLISSWFFKNRQ